MSIFILLDYQFEPEPDSDEESDLESDRDEEDEEDDYEEGSSSGKRRSIGSNGTPKKRRKVEVSEQSRQASSGLLE